MSDKWAWTRQSAIAIAPAEPRSRTNGRAKRTEAAVKREIRMADGPIQIVRR